MNWFRTRVMSRWRAALASVAVLSASAVPVAALGSSSDAVTPPEFGAVTLGCATLGLGVQGDNYPVFTLTLYNTQGAPSASATASLGTLSAPLQLSNPEANQGVPGAYLFTAYNPIPVTSSKAVTISVAWADSVSRMNGTFQQLVGVPDCNTREKQSTSAVAIVPNPSGAGYWTATSIGSVQGFGQAENLGDMSYIPLNAPIVSMAPTAGGSGYWLLGADGGVFSFGTTRFYGSTANLPLNSPVVSMAATPDGGGYWFVAADGGVFAFGDAQFHGSMGGMHLNRPIVGMAVDEATGGYWLVASDGGVFSFDAPFHGSTGALKLNSPVVGMQASPDGSGYRLGASDGGVFSFFLPYAGSFAGLDHRGTMVGIAGQGGTGYWLVDSCGGVFAFGSASYYGSVGFICQ